MHLVVADLARDCKVSLVTCKTRYKELSENLVKVAGEVGLPWVTDVTVKNVVRHSLVLFGLMEAKSIRKRRDELVRSCDGICLKEIIRDCLSKEAMYSYDDGQDR
ncbi:zinc ion binding [Raphanus sativus]|nr:zinc ion binding [Raphanus sativus]